MGFPYGHLKEYRSNAVFIDNNNAKVSGIIAKGNPQILDLTRKHVL